MTRSAAAPPAGYSGRPLAAKLGYAPGQRVRLIAAPADYWTLVEFDPAGLRQIARGGELDLVHWFVRSRDTLARRLPAVLASLAPTGMLWLSWPKRAAGVPTDVDEQALRAAVLPLGFVDVKVCAVDAIWSALKVVRRRAARAG